MKFNPPPTVYILVHRVYKQKHFEVDSTVDLLKQLGKNNKKKSTGQILPQEQRSQK